jgi:hypothetical protein
MAELAGTFLLEKTNFAIAQVDLLQGTPRKPGVKL